MAVVLQVDDQSARIGLQPGRDPSGAVLKDREVGIVPLDGVKWARPASGPSKPIQHVNQVLSVGDVIYVDPMEQQGQYRLRQVPEISGAMVVMDPHTGRVLAMVGGFSFDQSQFNRATQALRQPGSSFKPIVYAAALDNGYTPSTIIMDAPIEIDMGAGGGIWTPQNYGGKFFGPSTLRFGLEESRNVMTVRLAQDIGMPLISEYAKRFGVYDELPPYLSYALGAGETTVMRMVTAYSMFDNGGRRVIPTLIDRIQDRYGHTIYKHDQRQCVGCNATDWHDQPEPTLVDKREQVIDPMTAYQITSLMEGVVQRGTGVALRAVGKPIAGKTGTTNDEKDVWFIGLFARRRLRRLYGLRQAAPHRQSRHRRQPRRARRARLHEGRARRQAADSVFACRRASNSSASTPRPECAPVRAIPASSWKPSSPAPRRPTARPWSAPTPPTAFPTCSRPRPTPAMSCAPGPAGFTESEDR